MVRDFSPDTDAKIYILFGKTKFLIQKMNVDSIFSFLLAYIWPVPYA